MASVTSESSYESFTPSSDSHGTVGQVQVNDGHTTAPPADVGASGDSTAEPTVPYTIVANMINALSQRIMNQISEDELERRLRLWEERAVSIRLPSPGLKAARNVARARKSGVVLPGGVTAGLYDQMHSSGGLFPEKSTNGPSIGQIKTSDLKHSLLAQARRMEHRKKVSAHCIVLFSRFFCWG